VSRRGYLDWLRGIAVLIMIEAHTLDSWTRLDDRGHVLYGPLMVLAGFGAPIFLFLAGVALALAAGSRQRKGRPDAEVAALARRRAWQVFGFAFLFRLQSMVISGGGLESILKVDILNVMGVAMLIAAVLWGWGGTRVSRGVWLALATVAFTMLTPLIRDAGILAPLPDRLEAYFRPVQGRTTFTLFPWAGFLLAGGVVGLWLDAARTARDERRANAWLAVTGLLMAAGGYAASYLPPIYPVTSFWTSSPTFFFVRTGILIAAVPLAYAWGAVRLPSSLLQQLGRASLFIYWVHVEMVYGVVSAPLHKQLPFGRALLAFAAFTVFLFLLARGKDRLVAAASPRAAAQTTAGLTP
jgi:uncharacterized membrane protein